MIFDVSDTDHFHMMDWWYNVTGDFWWIFITLGWAIFITTSILIGYFVHKDAVRRGITNSEVWLIIGLIFNVIGAFLYLLVRNNYNVENQQTR